MINYTIVVDNTGNQSLTAVTVSDPLIANLSGPVGDNDNVSDELDVDETWTYAGTHQQADIDNNGGGDGDIDNTATVSSNEVGQREDSASVPINNRSSYSIERVLFWVTVAQPPTQPATSSTTPSWLETQATPA
ncbi:MAG: hypothetical protein R2856_14775 [Caldilineaceae bacterium]